MNLSKLREMTDAFSRMRIAVIGDLMLDVYVKGNATRISPEAPVPVVHVTSTEHCLGGAANVMRNLVTLGAKVHAFGGVGQDIPGEILLHNLREYGIDTQYVVRESGRPTTEKQRIIAGQQQIVRIDFEQTIPFPDETVQTLALSLLDLIENRKVDAVIVEDYAKGLLSEGLLRQIVETARKHHIPVSLDPHPKQTMRVKGLTVMTPNRAEAFALAGCYQNDPTVPAEKDPSLRAVGEKILEEWSCDYLLMTLGPQGMALFPRHGELSVIPTRAREVYDVSGAGDTVIAAFTLAMLGGANAVEAAEFSNHAAGVVVGKLGTVAVELKEVIQSFEEWGINS